MVADVPFGAFLSGGIDSSAIVGAMNEVSNTKVNTFSVVFDESEYSEAKYAQIIAKKNNTNHTEIKVTPDDFLGLIPYALKEMDHPSGDGPNTYVVSKVTKEAGITMALSGLGGDELFAGYDVFTRMKSLSKSLWINRIPKPIRSFSGTVLNTLKNNVSSEKIAELLKKDPIDINNSYPISRKLYTDVQISNLLNAKQIFRNPVKEIITNLEVDCHHIITKTSVAEMQTYMQNVLLRDSDQMSMAPALEIRVPFLDDKLVE
jgi:asparagine synthase (glutamine-hydrolysing)